MALELRAEPFAYESREVPLELGREVGVFWEIGCQQLPRERDLAVREEDRELGRRETAAGRLALGEDVVARQELQLPVQDP